MVPSNILSALAELTLLLEKELRDQRYWQTTPPTAAALSSEQPYCFDTLEFPAWLQWVYLPQLKKLVEEGDYLPVDSDVGDYAEETLPTQGSEKLVMLLHAIDEAFHDNARQTPPLH